MDALAGRRIWLTRPAQQAAALQAALEARGARVLCLPLLDIVALEPKAQEWERLKQLDRYDFVVYVSPNAARLGLERIFTWWPQYPADLCNLAVGSGTAAVLQAEGLDALYPSERMDSEGLLALEELRQIAGKRALILRGVGGRELLTQNLRERGCSVDHVELYERRLPSYPPDYLAHCLTSEPPGAVVLSSAEAIGNLRALFEAQGLKWRELPLYVASERLREQAAQWGFHHIKRLDSASDAAIIAGLSAGFAQQGTHD
ncbi:MAG: uroporphyrinogen-III synthase [Pseudomonadales bacterium]|jgi:uroporphyrinogen-III synthase|nr:uroporphyrinogen-III synthase [Pseudomonadales bacterium]